MTTTYDAAGNVSTVTDANGGVTSYAYDLLGNRTAVTRAVGTAVQDHHGIVLQSGRPSDQHDRCPEPCDDLRLRFRGNQTSVTDPLNHTTTTPTMPPGK